MNAGPLDGLAMCTYSGESGCCIRQCTAVVPFLFLLACFHVDESGGKGGKGRCGSSRLMGRVDVVPCKTTVASDSTSESGSGIWLLRVEGTATTRRWVDGAVKCFFRRRRHWPPPPPFFFPLFRSAKPRPEKLSRFLPPSSPSTSLFIFLFFGGKAYPADENGSPSPPPRVTKAPQSPRLVLDRRFLISPSSSAARREGGSRVA